MTTLWETRFGWLRDLGFVALVGFIFIIVGIVLHAREISTILLVTGALLCIPGAAYLYLVTIWHWKSRYRGKHSDLWGAILLIETSGWFKLVYLFRHIIPDARRSGRYANQTNLA